MPPIGENGDKGIVSYNIISKLVTSNYLTNAFYSKYDYKASGVKVKYLEVIEHGEVIIYQYCMQANKRLCVLLKMILHFIHKHLPDFSPVLVFDSLECLIFVGQL